MNDHHSAAAGTIDRAIAPIWRLALKRVDPIVPLNAGDPEFPLYCVHSISGDVAGLGEFAALLGSQHLSGIQVPREKMNGTFGGSIEAIARHYIALIVASQPKGPINLAGWSAGAIIALEMAQQLCAVGREVPLLVALDGAPCNTGAGLKAWNPIYMLRLILNLPRWIRDDREQDWTPRGIYNRVEGKLACRFGVGASALPSVETMDADTVEDLLRSRGWSSDQKAFIHAMYRAMVDYVPRPYAGRVLVFETRTQPLYHLRQIGAAWRKIAGRVEIVTLDGNHSGIIRQPAVGTIARHLTTRLAAARAAGASAEHAPAPPSIAARTQRPGLRRPEPCAEPAHFTPPL